MPLPVKSIEWPPAELATVLTRLATYDAWVTGDVEGLVKEYAGPGNRPGQFAGGVVGAVSRLFWGKPVSVEGETRKHAPLASDICRVSGDLLFSDPVSAELVVEPGAEPDETTTGRLNLILESLHPVLVSASEMGAAFGGTYLRATWDEKASETPFVTKVDADLAWPTFRWGRLESVVFWRRLATENSVVWRHLESHEVDEQGIGVIRHGLYEGTEDRLGSPRPFADRPETAWLDAEVLDDQGTISTGTPGLDVVYVRNLEGSKLWRKDPVGANLGGSDLENLLGDLDAYDQAYTSLMRDLEDGKSRLIVSESALDTHGPGEGLTFNRDQSIFTPIGGPPSSSANAGPPVLEQVQFKIRVEEHLRIMDDLMQRIIRSAGYSPRSFGIYTEGDKTATEIRSEDELSTKTRKRKIRSFEPAIEEILGKCLAIDAAVMGGGGLPDARVNVEFPDSHQETPLALSQLVQNLRTAEAASTQTIVEVMHPGWDADLVAAEVDRIMAERGTLPDVETFGTQGEGLDYGGS